MNRRALIDMTPTACSASSALERLEAAVLAELIYRTPNGEDWHEDPSAMAIEQEVTECLRLLANDPPSTAEGVARMVWAHAFHREAYKTDAVYAEPETWADELYPAQRVFLSTLARIVAPEGHSIR